MGNALINPVQSSPPPPRTSAAIKPAIAIVGIGCRLPGGANDPATFWQSLKNGGDAITEVPKDRWDTNTYYHPAPAMSGKTNSRWGGFIQNIDQFDAGFFGVSPREAARMDPQHRLLLEVAYEALEDGGLVAGQLAGTATAVFIGLSSYDYATIQTSFRDPTAVDVYSNTGAALSLAANRISYHFNWKGPSAVVDTACSSSLLAVHMACQAIWEGGCSLALAGGVNVLISPAGFLGFSRLSMLSPEGRCKAFDARADGFVRGEGVGLVVLKPVATAVADGDRIYALIRSTAVNQDGRTQGLTVPSQQAQEELVREACREAGVSPAQVRYVEAHGTGTLVGDPIEAKALGTVLGAGRPVGNYCVMGSVKTNVGHLEPASGIVGLIKTALVLRHREIPPNLHFQEPNPEIPFAELRLRVPLTLEPLPEGQGPALACVNSFGFGGTNTHALLQEAPTVAVDLGFTSKPDPGRAFLIPLSARTPSSLRALSASYARFLTSSANEAGPSLEDVIYSTIRRRAHQDYRLAVVARSTAELAERLEAFGSDASAESQAPERAASQPPRVAFVFCGQGAQWWAMGRQLLSQEPIFRDMVRRCDQLLATLAPWSLYEELMADEDHSRLHETAIAQPAIFVIQVALAALWESWGVRPDAVVGHSVGEVAAAYVAGILTLEDAVRVIFHRARCMELANARGKMLAVGLSATEVEPLLAGAAGEVAVAAINGPASLTLSGPADILEDLAETLRQRDVFHRFLMVDYAFHSAQLDPVRGALLSSLEGIAPRPSVVPYVSTVTRQRVGGSELDGDYWWLNLRNTVHFAEAVDRLIDLDYALFLEVGPHPVLGSSLLECLRHRERKGRVLPSLRRPAAKESGLGEDERETLLRSLGILYTLGYPVDWQRLIPQGGRFIRLPTYAWQHERYWHESEESRINRLAGARHPLLGLDLLAACPSWESRLERHRLAYLDDHRAMGHVLLPGMAYLEIAHAAAAAAQAGVHTLQDVKFVKACFLPDEQAAVLQTAYNPTASTFGVYSGGSTTGRPLTTHASGFLRAAPDDSDGGIFCADEIKARCLEEIPGSDCYAQMRKAGLEYGPAFQGLQCLWRGQAEALGLVSAPESIAGQLEEYHFHPALLDACIQVIFGTLPDAGGDGASRMGRDLYLPVGVERVRLLGPATPELWSHARLVELDRQGLTADVSVFAREDGRLVWEARGLRCQVVGDGGDETATLNGLLYESQWPLHPRQRREKERRGAEFFPDPVQVAPALQVEAARRNREGRVQERAERFARAMVPVYQAFVWKALEELGADLLPSRRFPADSLAEGLGVVPQHRRLFDRFMTSLAEDGLLSIEEGLWEVREVPAMRDPIEGWNALLQRYPAFVSELELIHRGGPQLAQVLRGEAVALELLFPGGSLTAAEHFYQDSPNNQFMNLLAQRALAEMVSHLPKGQTLRVLELGAGTGGVTTYVLPVLPAGRTEYVFTDVSAHFFGTAKQKFADYPFVSYQSLDIEAEPSTQGFGEHAFDLILISQALHATANLRKTLANIRQLLASEGLLCIVEAVKPRQWYDLVFGLLEGWWRFEDHDVRPSYPLVTFPVWCALLEEAGFRAVVDVTPRDVAMDAAVILARGPALELEKEPPASELPPGEVESPGQWVLLADRGGVAERLAADLRSRGQRCTLVWAGRKFERLDDDRFSTSPECLEDLKHLLRTVLGEGSLPCRGLVHFWNLDTPTMDGLSPEDLEASQTAGCLSLIHLFQTCNEVAAAQQTRWWVVTCGVQPVGSSTAPLAVAQAPAWGLVRVMARESPQFRCTLIDLSVDHSQSEALSLLEEVWSPDNEDEIALRGADRYVHRYTRTSLDRHARNVGASRPSAGVFRLEMSRSGTLDGLTLREQGRRAPAHGEVEIEVCAAGLNFSDVLKALSLYPGLPRGPVPLGIECSGRISAIGEGVEGFAVGDEVMAIAPFSLSSHLTTPVQCVAKKPGSIGFEEAATIPIAFLTAYYALHHLGGMAAGDRVLIHSATGGVGLAATQMARLAGAEVFATAGTPEKRELLRTLGLEHVMDSRSLAFADEVRERTGGRGVDLVLNSLSGEAIARGLAVMADHGRFLEIGKRDIYLDSQLGLRAFRKNLSFIAIDLDRALRQRPAEVGTLYRNLLQGFHDGTLSPLPHRVFPASNTVGAFRCMAQAKHVGKIVVNMQDRPSFISPALSASPSFRHDATYLVTGGLGGFGLVVAGWLIEHGARHLVLAGRRGLHSEEAERKVAALRDAGARVEVIAADVSQPGAVADLLARLDGELPPLRGVFHQAMVLDDGLLLNLNEERLRRVLSPKMTGAWNLHVQTAHLPLDMFVLFSSLSSVIGNPGQANYAAANSFLDTLAHHRRGMGLPALTVNWGYLGEVGYVSQHSEVSARLAALGVKSFTPGQALTLLGHFLRQEVTQVGVMSVDWSRLERAVAGGHVSPRFGPLVEQAAGEATALSSEDVAVRAAVLAAPPAQRKEVLQSLLRDRLARVLGTSQAKIEVDKPLLDMGIDSLMAVELRNWIEGEMRISLPIVDLIRGPSIAQLTDVLLVHLNPAEAENGAETSAEAVVVSDAAPEPVEQPQSDSGPESIPPQPTSESSEEAATLVVDEPFPCTTLQSAYLAARWLNTELAQRGCHVFLELELQTSLDVSRMGESFLRLIARHEALRLVFARDLTQRVLSEVPPYEIAIDDWRVDPEPEQRLHDLRERLAHQVFDPLVWPLFEVRLARLADARYALFISFDMLIVDLQSVYMLVTEIQRIYLAPGESLPTAGDGFRRHALRLAEQRSTPEYARDRDYWTARVATFPLPPPLPLRGDPSQLRRPRFQSAEVRVSPEGWTKLRALAREHQLTPSALLASAFGRILSSWGGAERFSLNLPINDRPSDGEPLIGAFTSVLLLDVDMSGEFWKSARRLHDNLLEGLDHGRFSGVEFARLLALHRKTGMSPVAPVVFTPGLYTALRGAPGQVISASSQTPHVWLDCQVLEDRGALWVRWDYVAELFDSGEVEARLDQLRGLLEQLADTGEVGHSPGDAQTPSPELAPETHPSDVTLVDLFLEQVRNAPGRTAVIFGDADLTYGELEERSGRIAGGLSKAGIGPGQLVAVCSPAGGDQIAALLGILRVGAAYLPLDVELPAARVAQLLEDSRPDAVVADRALAEHLPRDFGRILWLDDLVVHAGTAPAVAGDPDRPAYVIYTSGSTGAPKGVVMTHRAVVNTLLDVNRRFGVGPQDRVLGFSRLGFDLSVYDIFGTLAAGAAVVPLPEASRREPRHWLNLVRRDRVTVWNSVPSAMEMLVAVAERSPGENDLRLVLLSGDWTPLTLPDRVRRCFPRTEVISLGGATECAVWSCYYPIGAVLPEWNSIPYGRPLTHQTLHVLDEGLQAVAEGVAGDLYIGGRGLALGYLNDPERTSAAFITAPWTGERLYRTGDRARSMPDGNLEFLGRADQQVKVRGYRIELAEVEASLARHPALKECAVVLVGEAPGPRELAAYYVAAGLVRSEELRAFLRSRLPDYMVPDRWIELERLPYSSNGKVDREGLRRGNGRPVTAGPASVPTTSPQYPPAGVLWDPRLRAEFKAARHGLRQDLKAEPGAALPRPGADQAPAWLKRRRSYREFSPGPVPLQQLGGLLHGLSARVGGDEAQYFYGSAGSAYPVQVYLHVRRGAIEGLGAGTYYYHPDAHRLVALAGRAELGDEVHFPTNRPLVRRAAFSIFLVGQMRAIAPLYGDSGRHLATLEAGLMAQLLESLAPEYDLGLCQVGMANIDSVREAFRLDADHVLLHSLVGGSLPVAAPSVYATSNGSARENGHAHLPAVAASALVVPVPADLSARAHRVQAEMVRLWKEALDVEVVDVNASFFEMGGNSVRAMELMTGLQDHFGVEVNVTDLFTYSTLADLAQFVAAKQEEVLALPLTATSVLAGLNAPASHVNGCEVRVDDIAVIGLAGRFPGGPDLDRFWQNLVEGQALVRPLPERRAELVPGFRAAAPEEFRASYIDDVELFDPQFFRLSPREAKRLDPGQRLLLETCHELLETAGYGGRPPTARTGVFVAGGGGEYWQLARDVPGLEDLRRFILGSMPSVLANRISHALNLTGPSMTVDTGCSSSLVALDLACQALKAGDCESAIVSAVNLILSPAVFAAFRQDGMEAVGGQCRTFDASADGFVRGEGVAALLLKPLRRAMADGDQVHAVIKGTAVNHDGRMNALEIPNPLSQREVIALAHQRAGTRVEMIDYIEAHGTGTALGDPIEFKGLVLASNGARPGSCGLGSVKSNLGHLEYAAGMAGLIKVILALRHGVLPPSLHFRTPNPHLDFANSPFYLVDRPRPWPRGARPRRAAISSFGMGGTNSHVIVEEAPDPPRRAVVPVGPALFLLSARNEDALKRYAERFHAHLEIEADACLADVCFTAAARAHHASRLAVIAETPGELARLLDAFLAGERTVGKVWTGTPAQTGVRLPSSPGSLAEAAEAYVGGAEPDWPDVIDRGRRVPLPTYPFDNARCWLDVAAGPDLSAMPPALLPVQFAAPPPPALLPTKTPPSAPAAVSVEVVEGVLAQYLGEALELPAEQIDYRLPFYELGLDSVTGLDLHRRLEDRIGVSLPPTLFFDAPTVEKLAETLVRDYGDRLIEVSLAGGRTAALPGRDAGAPQPLAAGHEPIAIIGMAGRFPGAADLETFWENLRSGVDSITEVPPERWDLAAHYDPDPQRVGTTYGRYGGFLEGIDRFDPLFFRSSPREARWMDPQQRLLLETAWEALEDAGHAGQTLPRDRCGIFIGASHTHFRDQLLTFGDALPDAHVALGNHNAILASRLSYFLDVRGPCLTVDTLCSSSLVALHLAVASLRRGECDAAIVGGVHAGMSPLYYQALSRLHAISPGGRCRSFARDADGYVPGEAVGVVVLKRLSEAVADGDQVYGVVRGSAVNHSGQTAGLTVPSPSCMAEVASRALSDAGLCPDDLDYIEAHGTGTSLGDTIEVGGLNRLFPPGVSQRCGVGSLKTNVGHLEPASGVGSLIKVLLSMRAGELPPNLHLAEINPMISFEETPFYAVDRLRAWPRRSAPRRASINGFGIGGTNAHVVVEEAPAMLRPEAPPRPCHLLVLSARTETALQRLASALSARLDADPSLALADVCFTAAVGRSHFAFRLAVLASSREGLRRGLTGASGFEGVWRGIAAKPRPPAPKVISPVSAADLAEVARAYVAGADIDWIEVLGGPGVRRVSLPTYPFDKVTCRPEAAESVAPSRPAPVSNRDRSPLPPPHHLLGAPSRGAGGELVFEMNLGSNGRVAPSVDPLKNRGRR